MLTFVGTLRWDWELVALQDLLDDVRIHPSAVCHGHMPAASVRRRTPQLAAWHGWVACLKEQRHRGHEANLTTIR